MRFEDAYDSQKIYVRNRHKKQGFYNIVHDFECRVLPYFSNRDIYSLTREDMIKWQETILSYNFSNAYNKRLYYVFNLFLDFCSLFYNIEKDLLRSCGNFPKKVEKKKSDFYTIEEFNKFISHVDNIVYKTYYEFMFDTGCRPGEAMALRFCDINCNYVNISHTLLRHGSREIDTPKNQSSFRSIIISDDILESLQNLRNHYKNCDDNCFVFGGAKPISSTTADRIKKNACYKANLRTITQHQFRHSHATFLIDNNIPVNEVSRRLGHSSISTTLNTYCHYNLANEKRVLTLLSSQKSKNIC